MVEDYRVEYEGNVYEGKQVSPGAYLGQTGDQATVFRDLDLDGSAELIVISLEENGADGALRMTAEVFYEKDGEIRSTEKAVLSDPALSGHGDSCELFFAETEQGVCLCIGQFIGYVDAFRVEFQAFRFTGGTLTSIISESFEGQYYGDFFQKLPDAAEREGFPAELAAAWRVIEQQNPANMYCNGEPGTEMIALIRSGGNLPGGFMGAPLDSYLTSEDEEIQKDLLEQYGDVLSKHIEQFENGAFGVTGFIDIVIAGRGE